MDLGFSKIRGFFLLFWDFGKKRKANKKHVYTKVHYLYNYRTLQKKNQKYLNPIVYIYIIGEIESLRHSLFLPKFFNNNKPKTFQLMGPKMKLFVFSQNSDMISCGKLYNFNNCNDWQMVRHRRIAATTDLFGKCSYNTTWGW